jgi:hypothetical protein
MPGTLSANGTWQIRLLETGSFTPYSTRAIQSYIFFFDQLQQSRNGGINTTYELASEFKFDSVPTGSYYFQLRQSPNSATGSLPLVTLDPQSTTKSFLEIKQVNQAADGRVMDIPSNMPFGTTGIKLVDFIKGIQKKFNLIIYPDRNNTNNIIVETFNNWYNKGEIKDFNKYLNLNKPIDVISANNLAVNKLNFGDTLDTDYISQQFGKAANREYGKQYYVDTTNFFSQGEFEVKTTFASDPLIKIAGTGLSGSVSGIDTPVSAFSAGTAVFSPSSNIAYACSAPFAFEVFTVSGTLTQGQIAYYDRYKITPITSYFYFTPQYGGAETIEINRITGEIGYGTGNFC